MGSKRPEKHNLLWWCVWGGASGWGGGLESLEGGVGGLPNNMVGD